LYNGFSAVDRFAFIAVWCSVVGGGGGGDLMKPVTFTIKGKTFTLTKEDVEKALEGLEPEPLSGRAKYYIEHKGRRYPIKQVLAATTGLPRLGFTAMHAHRILTELGFEVKELGRERAEAFKREEVSKEPQYYSWMLAKRLGKRSPEEAVVEVLKNPDKYPEDAKRILVLTEERESDGYEIIESTKVYFLEGKVNFFDLEEVREGSRVKTRRVIIPEESYAIVALERVRHKPKFERELVSVHVFAKDSWRALQLA
jgi:hypothetical protein